MPRQINPVTLQTLCLKKICRTMEKQWYAPFEEHFGNTSRLLHVIGPFDYISSELVQKVIDVLREMKLFNPKYLQLLLSNHLHHLDLSEISSYIKQNSIAESIGIRCYNLTKLSIKNCTSLSKKSLVAMVTYLKKLQHLCIANTRSDTQVLEAVAMNCCDLVSLDAADTQIQSLLPLMSGKSDIHVGLDTFPLVKLRYLNFYRTWLSLHQVVDFLKLRGTFLMEFIFEGMVEVIELLYSSDDNEVSKTLEYAETRNTMLKEKEGQQMSPLKLQTLNCDLNRAGLAKCSGLATTVLMCPNVTSVTLTSVFHGELLLPLKNCPNLTILSVFLWEGNLQDGVLHYDIGVKPVLETIGQNMKSLTLHNFAVVDIQSVASLCPLIRKIDLFNSNLSPLSEVSDISISYFQHLLEFYYGPSEDEESDSEDLISPLSFVLKNSKLLRIINLKNCSELDDTVVSEAFQEHSFRNLEVFDLSACKNITGESIELLLLSDNNLRKLHMDSCWCIHQADYQRFKKLIKKNHFDLNLFWV